jgi:hypothetical protein
MLTEAAMMKMSKIAGIIIMICTLYVECLWFLKLGGGSNEKIKINCQK